MANNIPLEVGRLEQIGKSISSLLAGLGLQDALAVGRVFSRWEEIAGPLAAHVWPEATRGRVLVLRAENGPWAHHLSFLKQDLLRRLAVEMGISYFDDLKILPAGGRRKESSIHAPAHRL